MSEAHSSTTSSQAQLVSDIKAVIADAEEILGATADQEEVAQLLGRYDLLALPVVDDAGMLIGIVHVDDVVDVLEEEATEDIYKLAQVDPDSEIYSPIFHSLRNRLPWLVINLFTASLSAIVISRFEATISSIVILAALMPIVASTGGIA